MVLTGILYTLFHSDHGHGCQCAGKTRSAFRLPQAGLWRASSLGGLLAAGDARMNEAAPQEFTGRAGLKKQHFTTVCKYCRLC